MRRALIAGAVLWLAFMPVPARAAQHTVNFSDSAFSPASIRIATNDDVFWCGSPENEKTHSITADDGSFTRDVPPHSGCTWLTFQVSDSYPYHCKFVEGMTGTITVGGGATPVTSAPKPVPATSTTVKRTTTTTSAVRTSTTRNASATTVRSTSTTTNDAVVEAVVVEDTTTTAGQVAIHEQKASNGGGGGKTLALAGVIGGIAAGAAYVFVRGRHLRLSQWS